MVRTPGSVVSILEAGNFNKNGSVAVLILGLYNVTMSCPINISLLQLVSLSVVPSTAVSAELPSTSTGEFPDPCILFCSVHRRNAS